MSYKNRKPWRVLALKRQMEPTEQGIGVSWAEKGDEHEDQLRKQIQ